MMISVIVEVSVYRKFCVFVKKCVLEQFRLKTIHYDCIM